MNVSTPLDKSKAVTKISTNTDVKSLQGMDSKERFTSRVDAYKKFRPHYPPALLGLLRQECGMTADSLIADIGAGTGILSELFLQHGNAVIAVEPNGAMRAACAELVTRYPKLECIDGSAEATGIPDVSVDFVTVGQALHWFDRRRARQEFSRILRPHRYAVVLTNERHMGPEPFFVAYEQLLREHGIEYQRVKATYPSVGDALEFFAPAKMHMAIFPNHQDFDFDGLLGRTLSASYMPQPGHAGYDAMYAALVQVFERHQVEGKVRMMYDCRMAYGQLT